MATDTQPMETKTFQAEVTQLLDIVIHSLYTDKEIFLRELISNASDALEKMRHELLTDSERADKDLPLEITITADEEANTLTISDTGIGLSKQEMEENLGTIAKSGTKQFFTEAMKAAKSGDMSLIGQFGVGFYSAFMVADRVVVESKSHRPEESPARWESAGAGEYSIGSAEPRQRGTTITLHLKEEDKEFTKDFRLREIVKRFSSFVSFPVMIGQEKVNTVQALWKRSKNDITEEEYNEFYKFISNAHDEPRTRLHFSADAPLAINALLFVPQSNFEKFGFGRTEPGVDLYCKKVLIEKGPEKLLPDWMRFVRGVVDSDDLPLNISRESMQDSALIRKLSRVIANRFIKHLDEESNRDPKLYKEFFDEFGRFIKEGIATEFDYREKLAKLLRFETSKTEPGEYASLADYVSRMKEGQEDIVYINGPSREAIENGPYVEALRENDIEVIYTFDSIDDFVFDNLNEYEEKKLKSADSSDLKVPELEKKEDALSDEEADKLAAWIKERLGEKIGSVRQSKRLVNQPAAIVSDGPTASMQRMMAALSKGDQDLNAKSSTLEINPSHPMIKRLHALHDSDEDFAKTLTDQLFNISLLAAGLVSDPRAIVDQLNAMLSKAAGA